jgi:hypothetical protein
VISFGFLLINLVPFHPNPFHFLTCFTPTISEPARQVTPSPFPKTSIGAARNMARISPQRR